MISRQLIYIVTVLAVLATGIVLIVFTQQQEKEFTRFQVDLQQDLLSSASEAVSAHIAYQRNTLELFVAENYPLLFQLRINPQHSGAYATLKKRVTQKFPDHSNFTIIDEVGQPIWMDIEAEVGPVCKNEIEHFSKQAIHTGSSATNAILIHPNVNHYHYDLMSIIPMASNLKNLFLVSVLPDAVAEILRKHEYPGHQLMLVKKGDSALIEITTEGARDKISRDIRLSRDELKTLKPFADVEGTNWRLVDLPDHRYLKEYRAKLWKGSLKIALFVLSMAIIVILLTNWMSARR